MKTLITVALLMLVNVALCQEYRYDGIYYMSKTDTTAAYNLDSVVVHCGRITFSDISINKTEDGKIKTNYLIKNKSVELSVGSNIVYNICINLDTDEETVIFVDNRSQTINIGKIKRIGFKNTYILILHIINNGRN